jgi:hypothetical protein
VANPPFVGDAGHTGGTSPGILDSKAAFPVHLPSNRQHPQARSISDRIKEHIAELLFQL